MLLSQNQLKQPCQAVLNGLRRVLASLVGRDGVDFAWGSRAIRATSEFLHTARDVKEGISIYMLAAVRK
jgi:hypothetical protein